MSALAVNREQTRWSVTFASPPANVVDRHHAARAGSAGRGVRGVLRLRRAAGLGRDGVVSDLQGQTVVVIGGSAGIGLETARLAHAEGAEVILTGRSPERLERAASDVGARETEAFDATDADALARFVDGLPTRGRQEQLV
jgi:NADPH:quinone reductase-like Zn-dependent oxidoreductase